jgi:hypothetical protein
MTNAQIEKASKKEIRKELKGFKIVSFDFNHKAEHIAVSYESTCEMGKIVESNFFYTYTPSNIDELSEFLQFNCPEMIEAEKFEIKQY